MKWDRRTLIVIFSGTTLVACALSMHALVVRLQSINQCVFTIDNRLSSEVSARITDAITQQAAAGKSYSALVAAVAQEFPCVDDITLHRCAPGVLHCDIASVQPLIQINDAYIVSDRGALVSPDCFSPTLLHTLHTMHVDNLDEKATMPCSFVMTVQKLIPSLLDTYDARWIDDNKLVLQEKQEPYFSLICNAHTIPDVRLLTCCQQLKHDVYNKTPNKKANVPITSYRNVGWSADIRFEHQIILASPSKPVAGVVGSSAKEG